MGAGSAGGWQLRHPRADWRRSMSNRLSLRAPVMRVQTKTLDLALLESMGELYKVWYGMPDKPCNARNTRRHLTHRDRPNRIIIGV